jgi:hypothetical protein
MRKKEEENELMTAIKVVVKRIRWRNKKKMNKE